jgi:hypothetical protein
MVRNGHSVILFPNWLLSNITYGTKWLWCKIHMVRNGYWLWYEIAILWYEMVNYGTKWLRCKIHMVRNCNFVVRNGKFWYEMVMVQNSYGTKWFLVMVRNCNFVVRSGNGTKWLWYEMTCFAWYTNKKCRTFQTKVWIYGSSDFKFLEYLCKCLRLISTRLACDEITLERRSRKYISSDNKCLYNLYQVKV